MELSKLAAKRIREDPSRVQLGLDRIKSWEEKDGRILMADREWVQLINTHSPLEIADILEMDNDEGQRLRSSMPFIRPPFFSEDERLQIIRSAFASMDVARLGF